MPVAAIILQSEQDFQKDETLGTLVEFKAGKPKHNKRMPETNRVDEVFRSRGEELPMGPAEDAQTP